jgi:BlaI family transcriptional regulator, penicillinase repressor
MAPEPGPTISDAERQVLLVLWEHGPSAARVVLAHLARAGSGWSRSTVITLLQRLERKGYVASDKSGHAFLFRAAVTRDELLAKRMSELADELCGGQWTPLLLAFARREKLRPSEVAEMQRLVDELSQRRGRGAKKRT